MIGHNSIEGKALRSIIDRIERLNQEKQEITDAIKEVLGEAKADGFDPKIIRAIVQRRKQDPDELRRKEEMIEIYRNALGDFANTDLGQAAIHKI